MPLKRNATPWLLLIPLFIATSWLAIRALNADAFWYDEILAVWRAGEGRYGGPLPISEVWARSTADAFQMPVYYLALAAWGNLAGLTELGGRSLSFFAGLLAIAMTYRIGRDLGSARVGLGAAAVMGTSAIVIHYLHELRAYAFYLTFTALVIWAYWRLVQARGPSKRLVGISALFVVSALLLIYTHYFGLFVLVGIGIYHTGWVRKDRRWWHVAALGMIVLLGYTPWLLKSLRAMRAADESIGLKFGSMNAIQATDSLLHTFSNGSAALCAFLLLCALLLHSRDSLHHGTRFVLVVGLVTFAGSLALNEVVHVMSHIRYVLALWVPLALLVAIGIDALARRGVPMRLTLGVWIVVGVVTTLNGTLIRNLPAHIVPLPFREMAVVLKDHVQPDDALAFRGFRDNELAHYTYGLPGRYQVMESLGGREGAEYDQVAREYIGDASRVWIGVDKTTPLTFMLGAFEQIMTKTYLHCATIIADSDMSLDLYAKQPKDSQRADIQFGDEIRLFLTEPVQPAVSQALATPLVWSIDANVPPSTYSVALHVGSDANPLVAQADFPLPESGSACTWSMIDVQSLPPGNYTLYVSVYGWESGKRLDAMKVQSGDFADRLVLGQFEVR